MNGKGQYYSNLIRRDHYLYRIYSGGVLLYVGVTVNPAGRIPRHRRRAWWAQVTEIRTDLIGTREEAFYAEWRAITTEKPVYNITHATPDRLTTGGVH